MSYNELPNYYAVIPATVRYDNMLKSAEKVLYSEITALASKNGYCFAQNKYFAELYGVTLITVSRWISHLQELKYIKTELIKNEKKEIVSRKIYIVDTPYYQKNQYPYLQKSKEGINKNVKDNIINNNIDDDIFYYIINNNSKVPKKFLAIIEKLEFSYEPYMLKYMKKDKIKRTGKYTIQHKISKKKKKAKKQAIKQWLKENMHENLVDVIEKINRKLVGMYAYYGINGMFKDLLGLYKYIKDELYKVMCRRSQKKINVKKYMLILERIPIAKPKIYVQIW